MLSATTSHICWCVYLYHVHITLIHSVCWLVAMQKKVLELKSYKISFVHDQCVWKIFSASAQSMKPKIFLSFIHSFKNFGFSAPRSVRSIFRRPVHDIDFSYPIILKFYTENHSLAVKLSTEIQDD